MAHVLSPTIKKMSRQFALLAVLLFSLIGCGEQPSPSAVSISPSPTSLPLPSPVPTATPLIALLDDGAPLPPHVLSRYPEGGQQITPQEGITLVFDQPMAKAATADALVVWSPEGTPVEGEITWPDDRTLRFLPAAPLQTGGTYLASLTTTAATASGVELSDPYDFTFEVVGALAVAQVTPADGATEIENDAVITVVFNRPVVPLVIVEEMGDLPQPLTLSPPVEGVGEWLSTSVYVFRPSEPLRGGTTYTARIEAGLEDLNGSRLNEPFEWQFTTVAPSIGSFSLVGVEVNPPNYYPGVLLDQPFEIRFRQPMDPASVEGLLSITSLQGERVPLEIAWDEQFTTLTFTPTRRMSLETDYTLTLSKEARTAYGGELREGLTFSFFTVPPPAILSVYPSDGSVQGKYDGRVQIYFASPMDFDTLLDNVVLTPAPEQANWYYNPSNYSLNLWGLAPSTAYTLEILPGMADIYGNRIAEGRTVHFTTGPREPSAHLSMPYGPVLYRARGPQAFYASVINVRTLDLRLYHLTADLFVDFESYRLSPWKYLPPEETLVWQSLREVSGQRDERVLIRAEPDFEGGPLPPGFYLLTLDSPQVRHYGGRFLDTRLIVVATANLTFKSTPRDVLVWLTDLESGEPLPGVPVTFYDDEFRAVGQGVTDADGLLALDLPPLEDIWASRFALAQGEGVFAFASSGWGSGLSPYDFGVWSDFYTPPDQPTVYLYTDRPIYRPGQSVYFKGVVRLNDDLRYSLPESARRVEIAVDSYEETVYENVLPLTRFGTFAGVMQIDAEAALGNYTMRVNFPGESEVLGYRSFTVAEYRRPEFQVQVTADAAEVLVGESYLITVQADFFSGGSVAGAAVDWTLQASPYTFAPGGELSRFRFSDLDADRYPHEFFLGPITSEVIASGQTTTDERGQAVLEFVADLSEVGKSQQLTLEATVTDLTGSAVSGRTSLTVHQSRVYAGIRAQQYVGRVGEEQTFELVAVDWEAQPLSGQPLEVEIVERRWHSVQEKDPQGFLRWVTSVEEIPVERFEGVVTDDQGRAQVRFVPPNGGVYRARVTTRDELGHVHSASAFMWVAGPDFIPWRQTNNRIMDLVADRDEYLPGDTAEILIASPFPGENYALLTVERGHIRYSEVLLLSSNSTVYRLPITRDMAPNVYVSVLVMRAAEGEQPPDFRMGIVELKVNRREQTLQVEVFPDREQAGPGEQVTYTVVTRDAHGQPVSAEVSLALTDLATLSLLPPNAPPILEHFYSPRALGVRTSMPIVFSIEYYNAEIEARQTAEGAAMGSGGGKGVDTFGVPEVRQEFPDTAFWEAFLVTDENGQATVTLTLPDNLTTWRMDARAVTEDTRVGQATHDLISTKPLLVRPQTPRFFVADDEVRLAAAVHNNTDQPLTVDVALLASGVELRSPASQQTTIEAGQQAFLTWDAVVQPDAERLDLVFTAEGGGYSDASRPPMATLPQGGLPVYRYEVPETVGTAGMLTEAGTRVEGISLPRDFPVTEGELRLELAPSLAAAMTDGLDYLEHYPYECTEQTVSRFLPNVLTTRALQAAGLSDPVLEENLKTQVNLALQRLYKRQKPDGGWGWWGELESDPITSAYVVLGLVEADEAGYAVNGEVLKRGLAYLRRQVQPLNSRSKQIALNRQAFLLFVLARAGVPEVSKTVQLYDLREGMALYARAFLAQALYWIDPADPRLETLLSDFASAAVRSSTGTHWEEEARDYWNWNTDTRTTAIVLNAGLQIAPESALNVNAVRWLMSNRSAGHWRTTQETAWALMALTRWLEVSGELKADYAYGVGLNGERLEEGSVRGDEVREARELRIAIKELLADQVNRLAIARDEGPGNLYYTAHLRLYLPVEQVQPLDRGVVVSRSYYQLDDPTLPVTQAQQGDLLLVRLTVVVPNTVHYLVVDDPLPAGLEVIDQSLETSVQAVVPQQVDYEEMWRRGWGWWSFEHVELRDERVVLSARTLTPGTYTYTYLARASTPGTFRVIPPTAQEFYFPEVYGRGAGSLFTVLP